MILQALCDYYDRKAKAGEIAPLGFEIKQIPFVLVIDLDGNLKSLKDTRERVDKKLVAKSFLVPQTVSRSGSKSWEKSCLLWDHYGYVLGYPKGDSAKERTKRHQLLKEFAATVKDSKMTGWVKEEVLLSRCSDEILSEMVEYIAKLQGQTDSVKKAINKCTKEFKALMKNIGDARKQQSTFVSKIEGLPESIRNESEILAVLNFYKKKEYESVFDMDNWMECAKINGSNLTFQIEGKANLVLDNEAVKRYQKETSVCSEDKDESAKRICLVTGNYDHITRTHNSTPIPKGHAKGILVSFQTNSGFDSYGKEQAFNAPVGEVAHLSYTTALNTLTKSESNRVLLGDSTIVFWSEKKSELEQTLPLFIMKPPSDDPDKGVRAVKRLFESVRSGKFNVEADTKFFVLSLAPNAARVAVRSWMAGTVEEFSRQIHQHFVDLKIAHTEQDIEYFPLSSLLANTALDYKWENVAPNLFGQMVVSVMQGTPYPITLLHSVIRRIRAEQSKKDKKTNKLMMNVTHKRAAIIKACINRHNRFYKKTEEELTVSLDVTNTNPAYLLGRLFAVLEKVQYRALKIETIRERYYGAFSSTPVTVYPQLMKLKNHHLAKMESGKNYFENLIGEIVDGLPGSGEIPRQLSLADQGKFAVGYYHQRQALK